MLLASSCYAGPVLWIADGNGKLGTVDVGTQAVNVIGSMGVTMFDIAFSPTGTLYGVSGTGNLYSIDPTTAVPTLIGSLGGPDVNSLVSSSAGVLYGANSDLYTINTTTGAETEVGPIGYSSGGDLAFVDGTLYLSTGSNDLVSLNTTTGQGTLVGAMGYPNIYGIASPDNINLYAAGGSAGTDIYSVDVSNGAATLLFDYGGAGLGVAYGMSFYSESGNSGSGPTGSVPEPSTIVLSCAGMLLGAVRWLRVHAN
jgi:hypothetical protein